MNEIFSVLKKKRNNTYAIFTTALHIRTNDAGKNVGNIFKSIWYVVCHLAPPPLFFLPEEFFSYCRCD